ncbi:MULTISPECIES: serine/threonine-protein kinase [unclassified Nocardioides]|uniref:serine/threonine-protein kinase n=1 Tax=unclassified Nocardioides TaxID=2615069 RepID=UPI0009F06352|nr:MULTISPECIES: serine/threonine-protein kinase [unclassified Nocardioides]GAW47905.1 Protein kinase [Nocardioides sp. PD653-B2]GAW53792.1 Protein kinase [Nocardioides sp. PD653]
MSEQPPTPDFGFVDDARRYRLDARIATGGMGEVWRATDTSLNREVAVKVLKSEYADNPSFRTRFEVEAQHAASLHHANIATVYDFGEAESADGSGVHRPYLVMELVDGQPLSALIRPGSPMDPAAVRDLLSQAAEGLGAAHAAGIVHRDVKPANLLVTPDRRVKITDFGIARAAEGIGLTQTGEVMGTPQYLSPEQAQGLTATPASDVYSLGVVAFECLTGRRPFVADTAVATALAHLRDPVPDLPPAVPRDLATVVTTALAKKPEDRFRDGAAFAAALRDPATAATRIAGAPVPVPVPDRTQVLAGVVADPTPTPYAPDEQRRSNPIWVILGVLLLVALVVLVVLVITRSGTGPGPDDGLTETPTQSSSAPSSPSEPTTSATTEDTTVVLDESDYLDRPVDDVARELGNLGLKVDKVRIDNPGGQIEGDVESVNPTGTVNKGDTITVSYWGPAPAESPTPSATPSDTPSATPSDTSSPSDTASPSS